jgi:hypothetical protein
MDTFSTPDPAGRAYTADRADRADRAGEADAWSATAQGDTGYGRYGHRTRHWGDHRRHFEGHR